ncbi:MFS transporter [Nocardia caishijiensis]|uniref:EmrB/QacA subfamily drug resistance transporter n=1 Tax=Nocardia caishijiensis TaxID=184756 RepID=A0ABQ6YJ47_9NOCA|nr:MFS transporter [Nocardia caishijiensis]KAF0845813.1 EmrB/QacA subfamily drug resistance transporter [Nocardia caishijiensis]
MTDVTARPEQPPTSPSTRAASRALAVAAGAAFIAFLDLSVVNIAFPTIATSYPGTPTNTLTWIVSGYAIAFAALLTPAGRLADSLGRRRLFALSLAGFAVTSVLCGLAPGAGWLIAGRLLQGLTAAFMVPSALALVLVATPREKIGAAIAAWTAAGGFAAVVGPAIGGALVETLGWRAVFLVNVPVAVALIVPALRLPIDEPHGDSALPDPLGIIAIALGLGAVVAGITEGQTWGWTAPVTLVALIGGSALVSLALIRSLRHPSPAVAVALWRNRRFALANAGSLLFGATMFAWLLAGPLFLDAMWGYSVLESAAALTVGAGASMVTSVIVGRITAPSAQRWAAVLGALMYTAALAWMSTDAFGPDPALWSAWVPAGVLGGGGIGIVVTVLGTAAASSVPPQQFAAGIGMNVTARQVGGAVGVAVLAAVFTAVPADAVRAFHTVFAIGAVIGLAVALLLLVPSDTKN